MTDRNDPALLSVRESVRLLREGALTAEQIVTACLERIDATESSIRAWEFLDRELALAQARLLDERRRSGLSLGALHGIPVGLKDIIDTADMPSRLGSAIHAQRQPQQDSAVVERLRAAGAVILGKTVTTEFAWRNEGVTRNPHNPAHGPGGSSSGSAAAVAAGHVPLAVGSQTGGSTIRPASYCGVLGYKPSRGVISRFGVLCTSTTLDHVGLFARAADDLAMLADSLAGYDRADPASRLEPPPRLSEAVAAKPVAAPRLAWLDLPYADRFSPAMAAGCEKLLERLGNHVERVTAPANFADLQHSHSTIHMYEIWRNLYYEYTHHPELLSDIARERLTGASRIPYPQYQQALIMRQSAQDWCSQFFRDYDAIISPSSLGEAPLFGDGTGDPVCSTIWTLCGLPCVSLPLLSGEDALPMGVQLIGDQMEDERLFRTARWTLDYLDDSPAVA